MTHLNRTLNTTKPHFLQTYSQTRTNLNREHYRMGENIDFKLYTVGAEHQDFQLKRVGGDATNSELT